MSERFEFGFPRTSCPCKACQLNCRHMPGFLIPSDLGRMIPEGADPLAWAQDNLLASPGALVMKDFQAFRIPTLVPAVKPDGSCIHLQGGKRNGRCDIHENAPFGCAFFDCRPERGSLGHQGLMAVYEELSKPTSLYIKLWGHLWALGRRQAAPEVLRARMARAGN